MRRLSFSAAAVPAGCLSGVLFLAVFSVLPAAAAQGGHGAAHAPALGTLLFPTINFVLYAAVLVFAYRKLGRKTLAARSENVEEALVKARQALASADSELKAAKARLEKLSEEKEELRAQFLEQGRKMQETIREAALKSAADIQRDSERRIGGELKKAKAEIRAEVVALAAKLARLRLAAEMSGEQDAQLREDTIKAL